MTRPEDTRKTVSESYARAVEGNKPSGGCCSGPAPEGLLTTLAGYSREALAALPADAVAHSFGCGNPIALAEIREGDTVLDLGSGAGIDLLLAAKLTGPKGKVIGVDMTPAMIARARKNAAAAGLANVEVLEGIIEDLPVESGSIDLVISNCVINLSPEKPRVFAEIQRVLRVGGRFSISDIVAEPMPEWIVAEKLLYSACISGALPEAEYLAGLRAAGLADVAVQDRLVYDAEQLAGILDTEAAGSCCCGSEAIPRAQLARVTEALAGKVASIRVTGQKTEGLELHGTLVTDAVKELVAIGAAIASNCEMCFKFHYNQARKLGVSKDDIRLAVETAQMVKDSPARSIAELAARYVGEPAKPAARGSCCGGGDSPGGGKCCG